MSDDRFKELADRMRAEADAMSSATLWATRRRSCGIAADAKRSKD